MNDGDFFDWTREQLADLQSPHFVSFLNVSNHAPFDAPLHELGEVTFSDEVMERFVGRSSEEKEKFAKHIKYADRKIGEMVETLKGQCPDALFVFAGDHTSSKLRTDSLQQVPFVLWNERVVDTSVDTSQ